MLVHSLGFMVYSHNHNFVLHKCMFSLGFMVYNNHTCPWLGVGYLLLIAWVSHELEVDKGSWFKGSVTILLKIRKEHPDSPMRS